MRLVCDEELDDVEVPVAGSPLHRSSDEVTAKCIDLSTLLQQVAARSELGVDSSPMEGGNVLLVAVGRRGFSRLDEIADGVYVAALGSHKDADLYIPV